ncbi:hypothetical protein HK103_006446 [Boothiomyces macroporosus]|uniref:Uncharacterized protein n=1 Tax=Boothiomyces macroporosus TaxID=261099 RepID=A0AAD5YAJ1_9FUNG|nr:hypothetical protein HK103_006446 [Boothiomyces macroporosus]
MSMTYEDESIISQRRSSLMSGRSSSYSTRSIEDAFTVEALMEEVKVWKNLYFETMLKLKNEQNRIELDSQDYVSSCWLQAEVGIKNVDNAVQYDNQHDLICSWLQAEIGISNSLKAALENIGNLNQTFVEMSLAEKQPPNQPVARTRSDSSITVFNESDECYQHDLNTTWFQASHAIQQKEIIDHSAKYSQEYLVSSWLQGSVGICNAEKEEAQKQQRQSDLVGAWLLASIGVESAETEALLSQSQQDSIKLDWMQATTGIVTSKINDDYILARNEEIKADWLQASLAIQCAETMILDIENAQQNMITAWIQATLAIQYAEFAAERRQFDQHYIALAYSQAETGIINAAEHQEDVLFLSIDYEKIQNQALETLRSKSPINDVHGEELTFEYACYNILVHLLQWKFNPTTEPFKMSLVVSEGSTYTLDKEIFARDNVKASDSVISTTEVFDSQNYLVSAWLQASLVIAQGSLATVSQELRQSEILSSWQQASSMIKQAEFTTSEQQHHQEYLVLAYNQAEAAIVNAYDYNNEDEMIDISIDYQELKEKAVTALKQKAASKERVAGSNTLENICYEVLVGILQWRYQELENPLKMTIVLNGDESMVVDSPLEIDGEISSEVSTNVGLDQEYLLFAWLHASIGISNAQLNDALIEKQQEVLVNSWLQASIGVQNYEFACERIRYEQEYIAFSYNQAEAGINNSNELEGEEDIEEDLLAINIDYETIRGKALQELRNKQSFLLKSISKQDSLENICLELLVQVLQWKFSPSPSPLRMNLTIDGKMGTLENGIPEAAQKVESDNFDQLYLSQSWMMAEIGILKAEQLQVVEEKPITPVAREITPQPSVPQLVPEKHIVLEKKLKDLSQKAKAERKTRRALVDLLISRVRELEDDHDFDYE